MKKIAGVFKLAAKAMGVELSDEEITKIEAAESEDDLMPYFDRLVNHIPKYSAGLESKGRAEIYNGFDAKLGEKFDVFKGIIGEDKLGKVKSVQGVAKLGLLADNLAEAFEELKKANKNGSTDDKNSANQKIQDLSKQIQDMTDSHSAALESQKSELTQQFESQLLIEAMYNSVRELPDIAKEYANSKIMRGVMIPDIFTTAKEEGLTIRRNQDGALEVLTADGTPKIEGGKAVTFNDILIKGTATYAKKNDGGEGGQGGVWVPPNPAGGGQGPSMADQWQAGANG